MNTNTKIMLNKQSRIWDIFKTIKFIESIEWIDSNSDDHYPNVCPSCDGFQEYRYDKTLEGHKNNCEIILIKQKLFNMAVSIADELPDGNTFINLVIGLHLSS